MRRFAFCRIRFRFGIMKSHLATLCGTFGVEIVEVNAATEIARRAHHKFQKGWICPSVVPTRRIREVLGNRWKEERELRPASWRVLSGKIKELGLRYRFPLCPSNAVFSKTYTKSYLTVYNFS